MAAVARTAQREWVRAWKPAVPGIHEVFHARFIEHAYPAHTHDTWTVFVVDEGAIAYDLESRHRGASGARVTILPPHVTHDGRAATSDGFRKRVLYVGTDVLGEGLIGRAVDEPDVGDPVLVRGLDALHRALADPDAAFEAESRFAVAGERLRRHLGAAAPVERTDDRLADNLRDLLDANVDRGLSLRDAASTLHATPAHLIRCFTRAFGVPPHRYLVGRRIDAARKRLLRGDPIASVAADLGFHDQAHFTRQFKAHVGITPGRYSRR